MLEGQGRADLKLHTFIDGLPALAWSALPDGSFEFTNQTFLDYTGLGFEQLQGAKWKSIIHSDDIQLFETWWRNLGQSQDTDVAETRLRRFDGQYRCFQIAASPLIEQGTITRWYGINTDIEDRKRAEENLRQNEGDLRTVTDAIRQSIVVLAPDGSTVYVNRVALALTGLQQNDINEKGFLRRAFHPDDVERVAAERKAGLQHGKPFELEMRIQVSGGEYRWQLVQYNPLKDEAGKILRWYCTGTDIDERKRNEESLRTENLALREEIDRSSMFEEIVGASKPMRQLLKTLEKVAPSDSTVLVLGETGTGKELIARAAHQRSNRSRKPFVSVNCAAIPQSLIASELFGHEKGAFTGALERRIGRFEPANAATLFLDEVGELPMETQITLLRVLQEREFERVGSNRPVSVDVRVIAATHRDLPTSVEAGTFRQDLFYRLNVFPIALPPLRDRTEDIPLLVEYFVSRFAKRAGKKFRYIGKRAMEQLSAYRWPGNIRELQNVVERAVILSEGDTFEVDDSWLKRNPAEASTLSPAIARGGPELSALENREVEMIEAVLAETHGRISGPAGAAAKLGIPRQTLESKMRRFGIDKYGRKSPPK